MRHTINKHYLKANNEEVGSRLFWLMYNHNEIRRESKLN